MLLKASSIPHPATTPLHRPDPQTRRRSYLEGDDPLYSGAHLTLIFCPDGRADLLQKLYGWDFVLLAVMPFSPERLAAGGVVGVAGPQSIYRREDVTPGSSPRLQLHYLLSATVRQMKHQGGALL